MTLLGDSAGAGAATKVYNVLTDMLKKLAESKSSSGKALYSIMLTRMKELDEGGLQWKFYEHLRWLDPGQVFNKKNEEQYPTWANMITHLHVDFDLPDWDAYVTAAKQKPLYGLALDETVADFWLNSAREVLVETEIVSEKFLLICQSAVMVPVNVFASDRYQKSLADRFPEVPRVFGQ